MYVYILVGSTICDTSTICKIQETANFTNRMFVAKIDLSQIEGSICQIEHSICDTSSYLRIYTDTILRLLIMYYFSVSYKQFATYLKSDAPESFFPVSTIQLLRIIVSFYILVTILHNTCVQISINTFGTRGGLGE